MDLKSDNDCPSPEAMGRLAVGDLDPEERARILDHAVTCANCGEEIALFRPLRDWASESAGALAGYRTLAGGRLGTMLLSAAAVVCLAIGTQLWLRPMEHGGEVQRGGQATWLLVPAAGATLSEPPRRLEFSSGPEVPAGATYEFQLFDRELTVLWRSGRLDLPRVELPEEVRRQLLPGESYRWRVVVNDGLVSLPSPAAGFVVSP